MLKILPKLRFILIIVILVVGFLGYVKSVQAQVISSSSAKASFVLDQEVTFVGKTATRANDFLKWTLSEENYRWITLPANGAQDPIQEFWSRVTYVVFALLGLFVLGAAFVMIITRGQNLTVMKFIPLFIGIVILIYFSYGLIRFMYQATDVVQGFFLSVPSLDDPKITKNIGPEDLLFIAFDYEHFIGFRIPGIEYDESAFISLLLVKLTAVTYYVMTGILLIRKIILWFFLIVSPVFPLLLFFRPVRNTAKIWIGEFFRWLFYAPLFALFLHGLVNVWRNGIPMYFDFSSVGGKQTYPTAINILLGGPGQQIDIANSVNLSDTFALYVVALLMLWVVILLPFLLLQIFLDYLSSVSISENPVVKKISNNSWFNRVYPGSTPPPSSPPPPGAAPFGMAKSLPFFNKRAMEMPAGRTISNTASNTISKVNSNNSSIFKSNSNLSSNTNTNTNTNTNQMSSSTSTFERASLSSLQTVRETKDVLKLANLSIPKMKDIARYETSMIKHDTVSKTEVNNFHETLEKISKPTTIMGSTDREKFTSIKEKLISQQKQGDKFAGNILEASKVSEQMNSKTRAVVPGQKSAFTATGIKDVTLPQTNQVQQVSIEEYEDVKKMWQENYQNMEAPVGPNGIPVDKHTFMQTDIENITETINLLSSESQENVDKGMERVANILPFLLLGGFSKTEVVSYLKAKLEAAKSVMTSVDSKKEEDDTMVDRSTDASKEGHAEMTMAQELPEEEVKEPEKQDGGQGGPPGVSN